MYPSETEGVTRTERRGGEEPEGVRIKLLGGFQVSVGSRSLKESDWRPMKAAALVKLLALSPGHRIRREQAMDLLWPNLGRRAASNNLRQTLHAARRVLSLVEGSRYLVCADESIVLCPEGQLRVDVEAFKEATETARRAPDPTTHRAVIDLYAGELLPEDCYEEWAAGRREELRGDYLTLLVELAWLHEERGEYGSAIEVLRGAVKEKPTLEEAHASLMRLYALSSRRGQALAQYEQLRQTLYKELDTEPSPTTRYLRYQIAADRFPSTRTESGGPSLEEPLETGRHNLPAPRTSFVGRERELIEIKRTLATTRLLTLTGAGGSGKTRLVMEVARDLVGAYPGGAWLVELAPLSEGTLIPQAFATALEVREQPGRPLADTLVDALKTRELLLVVDNCEHLVEAAAALVDTLLNSCPRLRILATSRELLRVAGEVAWLVPPLSLPDAEHPSTPEELSGVESARLFLERAIYRPHDFHLTQENAKAVGEICRKLDGVPLAIELAAAMVGTLSVEQISARLEDSLNLLTGGSRTAQPRQQTLKGALDWSYELLSEPERRLFGRLSVFAGGWTLEAAEGVSSGEGIEEENVLDLLRQLINKSLVVAGAGEREALRYRMLEPVRQYGREKLEESGEADAVQRRHVTLFLALAEEAEPGLRGARQGEWLERLEREHDNLRAALSWALESGETELGLRLGGALGEFWHLRGHLSEGRRWLEAALAKGSDAPPESARAKALARAGYVAWEQGDYERAVALSEESLALSRELGDKAGAATALYTLGWAAMFGNDVERTSALIEKAITLQREMNDAVGVARSLLILGFVANYRRDHEWAMRLYEESQALAREAEDGFAIILSLGVGALAALGLGDHQRTRTLCEEGLKLSRQMKTMHLTAAYLHVGASLAGSEGWAVRAARLWGMAESLREAIGTVLSPFERHLYEPYMDAARARLDESAWETAWAEGKAMPLEEAVEYALSTEKYAPPAFRVPQTGQALTTREMEVLRLISSGASNKEITEELNLSIHTIKRHVANVLRKLDVPSRTRAVARARELGVF